MSIFLSSKTGVGHTARTRCRSYGSYEVSGVGVDAPSIDNLEVMSAEHITFSAQHRTPNTQHRTPNTQHLTPNTLHRRASFLRTSILMLLGFIMMLSLSRPVCADITIKFDDLKDGDKISDVTTVVVHADSGDGINKVEFAIDDQLRYMTGSSPYTFKWDTIPEKEGMHSLSVTAIDANAVKKTVTLSLTIDNEINLGADVLAKKAQEALAAKDVATATRYSRRALKAEPENTDAARALAAVYAAKLDYERAVTTLEKAKDLDTNEVVLLELAGYRMHRAVERENAANFPAEVQAVYALRQKAADINLKKLRAKNLSPNDPKTHEIIGDALMAAARYQDATKEYGISGGPGGPVTSTNRLALAMIRNNQTEGATILLKTLLEAKGGDAATRAVYGLALLRLRRFADARTVVAADLNGNYGAALVIAAFSDAALGKVAASHREASAAVELLPKAGESHYALSMALTKLVDSEPEVIQSLILDPFESGVYLDYAARVALQKQVDRYDVANQLINFVLKNDPANTNAQIMKILLYFQLNKIKDAEPILATLLKAEPTSPDVQGLAAIYFNLKNNAAAANERIDMARKLDPVYFDLTTIPLPLVYLSMVTRKYHYRGGFFLTPESLYPPKAVAPAAE